jgi:phosphopantothenoylcysteine synthetase/decarboxylase
LHADGFEFIGPASGWQACRAVGIGRMSEPEEILAAAASALAKNRGPKPGSTQTA